MQGVLYCQLSTGGHVMARFIPPKVRRAMIAYDIAALLRMNLNSQRVKLAKKKRKTARFERGAAIFARQTPGD